VSAHAVALHMPDTGSTSGFRVRGHLRSLFGVLVDASLLLGVVFALPVVVIVVGAPIALALRLVLWLAGTL